MVSFIQPCQEAIQRCREKAYFRVVLFGASNTERYMPGVHWGDVLECGMRSSFTRKFHVINSGISGNNTKEALDRFDRDVASFQPDIVIITFGGNDCNPMPEKFIPDAEFCANLAEIVKRVRAIGAIPVLQTYYQMDLDALEPRRTEGFLRKMDLVRKTAQETRTFLVDQYRFFDRINHDTLRYKLLLNSMHVNEFGNMLLGVVLLHHFGIDPATAAHHEKLLPAIELFEQIIQTMDVKEV